mgnify:FL=1
MNTKKYLKYSFLPLVLMLGGLAFTACTDDIEGGKPVDEGAYDAVKRVDGMLLDVTSNKNESVIELRSDKYQTEVFFRLTKAPQKGVDVKIEVDPAYLETYNAEHGTEFQLFPAADVTIEREGKLLLAPDEIRSVGVGITLAAASELQEGVTYLLPLRATSSTEGITLSEKAQHAVYLVKDLRAQGDAYKGPDAVRNVCYFEVNDTNPLNALEFVLKDSGKLFFDDIILFSANINYNAETGRVYVLNNPNVQFLLDNNEQFLQPLRKRGMKVILGILGNHDAAGVAQLSDMGCREFAKELAAYFGTPEKPECHMLYNVSTMVNLWSALASRDTRLLKAQLDALHALPKNCWFVNYLRCHDDIGWGLDEAVENRLGIDPQKHKEYLYHFYEGNFPGSWAKGELYNYDPVTGDARSCGTTASLCGVEQALEKNDTIALDYAVKRDLLLHTAMAFLQGFPMLNCGDEIAQLNGWDYKNDPDRVEDSRNLHRSKFNWENAKQRTRKGTLQNALWQGMEELRKMRADECFSPDAWVTTWDSHNPGVLALVRKRGEETLVGLFNFTEYPAGASLDALGGKYTTADGKTVWLADVELQPYQALLVKKA